jgi:hypothetical protein
LGREAAPSVVTIGTCYCKSAADTSQPPSPPGLRSFFSEHLTQPNGGLVLSAPFGEMSKHHGGLLVLVLFYSLAKNRGHDHDFLSPSTRRPRLTDSILFIFLLESCTCPGLEGPSTADTDTRERAQEEGRPSSRARSLFPSPLSYFLVCCCFSRPHLSSEGVGRVCMWSVFPLHIACPLGGVRGVLISKFQQENFDMQPWRPKPPLSLGQSKHDDVPKKPHTKKQIRKKAVSY